MLPQTGHLCVRRSLPGLWGTMNATNIRLPHREHNGVFTFSVVVMHPSGCGATAAEWAGIRFGLRPPTRILRECFPSAHTLGIRTCGGPRRARRAQCERASSECRTLGTPDVRWLGMNWCAGELAYRAPIIRRECYRTLSHRRLREGPWPVMVRPYHAASRPRVSFDMHIMAKRPQRAICVRRPTLALRVSRPIVRLPQGGRSPS